MNPDPTTPNADGLGHRSAPAARRGDDGRDERPEVADPAVHHVADLEVDVPLASPIPSSVPPAMTSPGSRVMNRDANAMISSRAEDHVRGRAVLPVLSLTLSVMSQVCSDRADRVGRHDPGPEAAKPSPHLPLSQSKKSSNPTRLAALDAPLHGAGGDVVDDRVAGHVVARTLDRDVATGVPITIASSSSQSSVSEAVGRATASPGPMTADDGLMNSLGTIFVLSTRCSPTLLDVGLEVAGDRQELARAADRGEELDRVERLAADRRRPPSGPQRARPGRPRAAPAGRRPGSGRRRRRRGRRSARCRRRR